MVGGEGGGKWIGMGPQARAMACAPFVGQRLKTLLPKEHHTVLERLTELIENGHLRPVIDQTYSLAEMPDAMRHLVAGRVRGKLVVTIDGRANVGMDETREAQCEIPVAGSAHAL